MITTLSGTYTTKEYNTITKEISNAFIQYWHGLIPYKQLERIQRNSKLSKAEIKNIQYETSIKEMKKLKYLKGVV